MHGEREREGGVFYLKTPSVGELTLHRLQMNETCIWRSGEMRVTIENRSSRTLTYVYIYIYIYIKVGVCTHILMSLRAP
jgi:hypothetical protein